MSYTLSLDASVKIKRNNISGYARHIFREDESNLNHKNENIDNDLSCLNETYVLDRKNFTYERVENVSEIKNAVEERLKDVKRNLRVDATVVRPLILQLDPTWYEDNKHDEKRINKSFKDMIHFAEKEFHTENIVALSIHRDETSPHIHLCFVPVTDDGRLNQKEYFSNPASLKALHKRFKEHMQLLGYDIEKSVRKANKHVRRITEEEYRTLEEVEDKIEELNRRQKLLNDMFVKNKLREQELANKERLISIKEEKLTFKEENISRREKNIDAKGKAVESVLEDAKREHREIVLRVQEKERMLRNMIDELLQLKKEYEEELKNVKDSKAQSKRQHLEQRLKLLDIQMQAHQKTDEYSL